LLKFVVASGTSFTGSQAIDELQAAVLEETAAAPDTDDALSV
jgi:hypothetical protein